MEKIRNYNSEGLVSINACEISLGNKKNHCNIDICIVFLFGNIRGLAQYYKMTQRGKARPLGFFLDYVFYLRRRNQPYFLPLNQMVAELHSLGPDDGFFFQVTLNRTGLVYIKNIKGLKG